MLSQRFVHLVVRGQSTSWEGLGVWPDGIDRHPDVVTRWVSLVADEAEKFLKRAFPDENPILEEIAVYRIPVDTHLYRRVNLGHCGAGYIDWQPLERLEGHSHGKA